jgi:hypothetical protein
VIYFSFITSRLPAIASRSGEAGGDESDEIQSAYGGGYMAYRAKGKEYGAE